MSVSRCDQLREEWHRLCLNAFDVRLWLRYRDNSFTSVQFETDGKCGEELPGTAVYNYNLDYLRIQLLLLFQLLLSAGVCNNNMEIVHFGVALSPGYLTYKFRC